MPVETPLRIIESSEAARRLSEAHAWLLARLERGAVIVSASRGAADDLARGVAAAHGGAIGLHRFSFAQLAARLAAPILAARGIAPVTMIGSEAVAARATFEARRGDGLSYFEPVAGTPGFARALARTLHELTLAGVGPSRLRELPLGGPDLARLLEIFEEQFSAASATDRAALFEAASQAAGTMRHLPLLLLDVPLESAIEFEFAQRLMAAAPETLITVPFGDLAALDRLRTLGASIEVLEPVGNSDLTSLCRYLFAASQPPERDAAGDVRLFSAPGEGRECVEVVRRILDEARRGVRFDEMAVFLRSPRDYLGLLENAFDRAGVDAWFDRGTRRPHPSGRAFLAILSCAVEKLSAIRFAEYLSLAQVPHLGESEPATEAAAPPADDLVAGFAGIETIPDAPETGLDADPPDEERAAVVAGMLRTPWQWERLIVESAVIGGDPRRWKRRLAGLDALYEKQIREEQREDPESPRLARLERDRTNLGHLTRFALPIVETLASWPATGTWGEWLQRFDELAPRVLMKPARVLRVLGELRAMSAIGPVTLEEARDVLSERLRTLDEHPPADRYGRVFVGSPHQARGRAFKVVFVPGLAERLFPQKPREDPMLLDEEMRKPLDAGLFAQEDRAKTERLLLRLVVGAATERLWLSYPRLDVAGARPRVPSFYVLDVMRAITGRIPNHEVLQREAAAVGGAKLDWPAPALPKSAIDEVEHDLAVLRELIDTPNRAAVRGHAHYLLRLNDALRRSVTTRWARARSRWLPQDGLVRAAAAIKPMLDSQRLGARPYSVSALQKFATCPYQFLLSAIYRLEPNEEPEPLQRLDPLMRGALFHEVQAGFFRALKADGRLSLKPADVPVALQLLDRVLAAVAAAHKEELAPAIDRVWSDEIASIGRDLRVWVRKLPEAAEWTPEYFEFSFGLSGRLRPERPFDGAQGRPEPVEGRGAESPSESERGCPSPLVAEAASDQLRRGLAIARMNRSRAEAEGPASFEDAGYDPRSVPGPVSIDGRFLLRGAVDVIERHRHTRALRITDHKTGRNRTTPKTIVGGGSTLQPVIYGLAVETILERPVSGGRLFYCTGAGGFTEHVIPLSDANRRAGVEVLEIIDRAIELGFLPPAPSERACTWCDFRAVCGPDEPLHVSRKSADLLADLAALRGMP